MEVTAFDLAHRFVGVKEVPGKDDNAQILAMLRLDNAWPENDEVPWCSAFLNYICWLLHLPRSKDLRARSWLNVGRGIDLSEAKPGFDIVVLKRGSGDQPGAEVIDAPGHVGFFSANLGDLVELLGGNQGDQVKMSRFQNNRVLGVRRLLG